MRRSAYVLVSSGIMLGIMLALLAVGASAAPTAFSLTFDGHHVADPGMPFGLRHEGRFTATAPLCSAGRAYDTRQVVEGQYLAVWRAHVCDDGSGSFTAFIPADVANEHGGRGSWKIVEGTGRYAELRGQGTYVGTHLSGDPTNFSTVTYRTNWQGVADFDADAPVMEIPSASAKKLPKTLATYTLRVAVTTRDASPPIAYTVVVHAGKALLIPTAKNVVATTGGAAVTLRIKAPRAVRRVQIDIAATDALGNGPTPASRTITLAK